MPQRTRVLLIEDHAFVREALTHVLEGEPALEVVGQAGTLEEARQWLHELGEGAVDVALVDLMLPDGEGSAIIEDIRTANPVATVLILSASLDRAQIARAVESGAAGTLHKSASAAEIISSVRRAHAGESLLSPQEIMELLHLASLNREQNRAAQSRAQLLTRREREVLQALSEGFDAREIATRLHITTETERNHMSHIFAKLGVHSRLQAVVFAARHGIVKINDGDYRTP